MNFGVFAYTWMLAAIFLATQPKWLDRLIGLPDMYIIHGVTAIFALVFMYLHDNFLISAGAIALTGQISLYMFTAIIVYSLVFMAGWLTSRISFLMTIKKGLEKIFKHELSMWIHRLNILATILIYVHIVLIPYIRSITSFFILVTLYTIVTFGAYAIYVYKKYLAKQSGTLENVRLVDNNITELTLKIDKKIIEGIKAGDFAYISFPNVRGMNEPHPFSILNVPKRDGYVQMAIENVGDFTKKLPTLKKGEKVTLSTSYGLLNSVVKHADKNDKIVFIGGGVGVVPLLGLSDEFFNKDITFLYNVREEKELLYQDKFEAWKKRENFRAYCKKGRFSEEEIEKYLPIGEEYNYIIAGPMAMNLAYEKRLKQKGIKKNKIYYEGFNF